MAELRNCGPVPESVIVSGAVLDNIRAQIAGVALVISGRCEDELLRETVNPVLFKIEDAIEDILWPDNN